MAQQLTDVGVFEVASSKDQGTVAKEKRETLVTRTMYVIDDSLYKFISYTSLILLIFLLIYELVVWGRCLTKSSPARYLVTRGNHIIVGSYHIFMQLQLLLELLLQLICFHNKPSLFLRVQFHLRDFSLLTLFTVTAPQGHDLLFIF